MAQQVGFLKSIWLRVLCTSITAQACMAANLSPGRVLPASLSDKMIYEWAKRIMGVVNAKITTLNPHDVTLLPSERYIIMCNHTSLFDIPLGYIAFPETSIRMLAKKELTRIPIFNRTIIKTGTPVINRQNRNQAIKDMNATKKLMEKGLVLWMAPEGTRSRNGKLQPFKKGGFITAIQASAKIIPLAIKNADKIFQRDIKRFHLAQDIEMIIGKPVDAAEYALEDKDLLRGRLESEMKQLLK